MLSSWRYSARWPAPRGGRSASPCRARRVCRRRPATSGYLPHTRTLPPPPPSLVSSNTALSHVVASQVTSASACCLPPTVCDAAATAVAAASTSTTTHRWLSVRSGTGRRRLFQEPMAPQLPPPPPRPPPPPPPPRPRGQPLASMRAERYGGTRADHHQVIARAKPSRWKGRRPPRAHPADSWSCGQKAVPDAFPKH